MRSGTTTLHELLKQHPDIALPPGKEVPFFNNDDLYQKGLSWYLDKNFPKVKKGAAWGTITPQYMYSPDEKPTSQIANRIKTDIPDVKLIAILRHPVERAFSHYNYAKRHGFEDRSFNNAMRSMLYGAPERNLENDDCRRYSYLPRSKYGSQLESYYDLFSSEQLLILFTDELETKPQETLKRIFDFINVDSNFVPRNLDEIFHKGGAEPKVKWLTPKTLGEIKPLILLYRKFVPFSLRKSFEMWLHKWNIKKDNSQVNKNDKLYKKLVSYFDEDVDKLSYLSGRSTPWSDWK